MSQPGLSCAQGEAAPRRPKDPLALLARRGVCGWHLHPNGFPCVPPPGLAGTCLLFPSRREQPVARQGLVGLMAIPPRHKTRAWELPPGKASSTRCLNTRPKGGLLCNITLALVPPRPPWGLGRCRPSAAQSPLGPAWVPGLSVAGKAPQTCSLVCKRLAWLQNALRSQAGTSRLSRARAVVA